MTLFAYNPADLPADILVAAHLWCVLWIALLMGGGYLLLRLCWFCACLMAGWDEDTPQA